MKGLLLALCLVAGVVHAEEEWWESGNEAGGKIVLLQNACRTDGTLKTMRRMFATHKNGQTMWGCWNYWTDQVHVVYDNGDSYTYNPALFTRKTAP